MSSPRTSVTLSSEAMRIVEANKGRGSISGTVNDLVIRAGQIEGIEAIVRKTLNVAQRSLAIQNAVYEDKLVGEVEISRKEYLNGLRSER